MTDDEFNNAIKFIGEKDKFILADARQASILLLIARVLHDLQHSVEKIGGRSPSPVIGDTLEE